MAMLKILLYNRQYLFFGVIVISGFLGDTLSASTEMTLRMKAKNTLKCIVIEDQMLLRIPGEEKIRKIENTTVLSKLLESLDTTSSIALKTILGRTIWKCSALELRESSHADIQISFAEKANRLPSGIYNLQLHHGDFYDSTVGDTLDSVAGVGDINNDEVEDVIIAGSDVIAGVSPKLFLGDGMGGLIEDSERLPQLEMRTWDLVVFDADNDDDLDLFFVNIDEQNRIFINNGEGFFQDESDTRIPSDTLAHTSGDFADIDNDDDYDLLITGLDDPSYGELESYNMILINNGQGFFSDESEVRFVGGTVLDASMDCAFIDIENDNDPDILIANDNFFYHQTTLYQNDGTGRFTNVTQNKLPVLLGSSWSIAVGDLIPDQYIDIYIANAWNELNFLLENDRYGNFYDATILRTPYQSLNDSSWSQACAILDINLDNEYDIVVGNSIDLVDSIHPAQNRVLRNNGYGFFVDVTDSSPPSIPLVEDDTWDLDVLDANNDEKSDLFVTNGWSNSVLYLNVDGSLPTDDNRGNHHPDIPKTFALHQNYPNPFNPTTTISFVVPGNSDVRQHTILSIYDLRGRHVNMLINSELESGNHRVVWDGRNDRGEVVSSGVYFYTIKSREHVATRKMTVVR